MSRILGLVNLHTSIQLWPITKNRSIATLTFLGRYAFVDIPLSNFTNSNINTVGILVNRSPRSMIKHMDNAMSYTNNTKLGKTIICYNEQYANNDLYNTDINNIIENRWLIDESRSKYVVITPSHIIYELDFNKVIEDHINSGCDITCIYTKKHNGKTKYIDQDIFEMDENNNITEIKKNQGIKKDVNLSLESYVMTTAKLNEILKIAKQTSQFFNLKDIISYLIKDIKVKGYYYDGYVRVITSLQDYLDISLELLDFKVLNQLFKPNWPIYTKTHDTPPASYLDNAKVKNSFISNGAIIDGEIENSVICRDVVVKKGCKIKNSIILSGTTINEDAVLEYVIVDKNATILHVKELKGTKDKPIYVGQGDVI